MENANMIITDGMPTENGGMPQENKPKEKSAIASRERKRLIFYILMLIFPLFNFAVFYVYVNLGMFELAFTKYDLTSAGFVGHFAWFDNFTYIFNFMSTKMEMVTLSMSFYAFTLCMMPIAVIFSYYIYKGYPAANFFRVILYLPSIMSGIVMTFLYRMLFEFVFKTPLSIPAILFYNVWASFGMNMIMYIGAMCGINTSIPESANLDGATAIQEFWFITIPMIFPTIRTFLVMGIVHLFTNSANLYSFYGGNLDVTQLGTKYGPLGYFMTVEKLSATLNKDKLIYPDQHLSYPELSALGVVITLATLPVTLIIRRLLEKYGPSED